MGRDCERSKQFRFQRKLQDSRYALDRDRTAAPPGGDPTNYPRLGLRSGRPAYRNGEISLAGNGTKVAVMSAIRACQPWSKTLNITGQVNGHSSSESYSPLMMQKKIDMNSPLLEKPSRYILHQFERYKT